jgi:integrase
MDAHQLDRLTFLQTQYGAPYTAAGFGNFFGDARKAAALPAGLTAHGLRKGMGRRLAEAGASANEIMAVLTHTTLEEAELYTRAANRDRLAASALERIGG